MEESTFTLIVLICAAVVVAAVFSNRLTRLLRVPTPAVFLVLAAVAALFLPAFGHDFRVIDQRVVSIALVFILFDGGMHIGWGRFRRSLGPITWIGIAGTAVTAAAIAVAAHFLFGFEWQASLLLGAALAPTDPAVVFSVLGQREISGRSGTILEGESGANDPVGIALMVTLLGVTGSGWQAVGSGVGEFVLQLAIGAVVGIAGGLALTLGASAQPARRRGPELHPGDRGRRAALRRGDGARRLGVPRGVHRGHPGRRSAGAVQAGRRALQLGHGEPGRDRRVHPARAEHPAAGRASAGRAADRARDRGPADLRDPPRAGRPVARPHQAADRRARLRAVGGAQGSRADSARPVHPGSHTPGADRLYAIIFIVVLVSVLLQGGLVPVLARAFRVPTRAIPVRPWSLDIRFAHEPDGLQRHVVAAGSPADGHTVAEISAGDDTWISLISRSGRNIPVRNGTRLQSGDVVLTQADSDGSLGSRFEAAD